MFDATANDIISGPVKPPSARPRFEYERHRRVVVIAVGGTDLLDERGERLVDRRAYEGVLGDVDRHLIER
jgi:hypothetical protein